MPNRYTSRPRKALALASAVLACAAFAADSTFAADSAFAARGALAEQPKIVGGAQLSRHGIIVSYPPGATQRLPNVAASAFLIADANTGQVLAAKNPHGQFMPASTLKMLTAVTLIPLLDPNGSTMATKQAASVEPNLVGLIPGHSYQISDLFTALLTISANDAAVALAQAAGSFNEGMALINAEAHHLRADNTVAVQPNGLPAPGQHTSAYDLALVARQALHMPAFMKYDQTITARFPVSAHKTVTLVNQNELLTKYRGGIGGKIGWTSQAGATYVGMARRNGVTLIVTLLHCTPLTEIKAGERLLDWGFAMDGKVKPIGTLVNPLAPTAAGAAAAARSKPAARPRPLAAVRPHSAMSPSAIMAIAFTGLAIIVALAGFVFIRRQSGYSASSGRASQNRP